MAAHQAVHGIFQEHWSGLPFPSPGDPPNPRIEPMSPALQADFLLSHRLLPREGLLSLGNMENPNFHAGHLLLNSECNRMCFFFCLKTSEALESDSPRYHITLRGFSSTKISELTTLGNVSDCLKD